MPPDEKSIDARLAVLEVSLGDVRTGIEHITGLLEGPNGMLVQMSGMNEWLAEARRRKVLDKADTVKELEEKGIFDVIHFSRNAKRRRALVEKAMISSFIGVCLSGIFYLITLGLKQIGG